jgi:hypothetical protein
MELKLLVYWLQRKLQAYLIIAYCYIVYRVIAYKIIAKKLLLISY